MDIGRERDPTKTTSAGPAAVRSFRRKALVILKENRELTRMSPMSCSSEYASILGDRAGVRSFLVGSVWKGLPVCSGATISDVVD